MRLAVSLPGDFSDYELLCTVLNNIEFDEIVTIKNPLIEQYKKEFNRAIQTFDIKWDDINGATNIKQSKFGKMYNADAPEVAAQKVVDYSTHIVEFDNGDFNINKLAKKKGLTQVQGPPKQKIVKRYKF